MSFEPGTDVMAPSTKVLVAYREGEAATVEAAELQPWACEVGMRVFANHLNKNDYQQGTIARRLGGAVQVELKNGSSVWTTWAKLRIEAPSDGT